MTHTYSVTHRHYGKDHWLRFTIGAATLTGILYAFTVHWGAGVAAILPILLLNGTLNGHLDARATYRYLHKDCDVNVTWEEAKKYSAYFSPNSTKRWVQADRLRALPSDQRREALFAAISAFDEEHGSLI